MVYLSLLQRIAGILAVALWLSVPLSAGNSHATEIGDLDLIAQVDSTDEGDSDEADSDSADAEDDSADSDSMDSDSEDSDSEDADSDSGDSDAEEDSDSNETAA